MYRINPVISTYYVTCDEEDFEELLNKYLDQMNDWFVEHEPNSKYIIIKSRLIYKYILTKSLLDIC